MHRRQIDTPLAVMIVEAINELRQDEGSSVTILCENPDGDPQNVVVCHGQWTDWKDQRFSGDALDQALAEALGTYRPRMEGF